MHLKLIDFSIDADQIFGPMPFFNDSFEKFFIQKAFNLFLIENRLTNKASEDNESNDDESDFKYISLLNETDLSWMYDIELSKSSRQQNMEIIYNDNKVYFKTVKTIYKDEILNAFPSKDLEISLGLQFIPINSDNKYLCKKCSKMFEYQYNLMLHTRYFCTYNINNLLKIFNKNTQNSNDNSLCDTKKYLNKRKQVDLNFGNEKKKLKEKKSPENDCPDNSSLPSTSNLSHDQNIANFRILNSFLEKSKLNENQKLDQNFNLSDFFNSFQTAIQAYSKNIGTYDQYFNTTNQSVKDSILNQLAIYIENQSKISSEKKAIPVVSNIQPISPTSSSKPLPNVSSPFNNLNYQNDYLKNVIQNTNLVQNLIPNSSSTLNIIKKSPVLSSNNVTSGNLQVNQFGITNNPVTNSIAKPNIIDFKMSLNNQTLQNWCAKCNTHFRLTSDLVYHMRTFHKKEELKFSKSPVDMFMTSKYTDLNEKAPFFNANREIKYLKCEICNETFKEKHHLTRHLTSHR